MTDGSNEPNPLLEAFSPFIPLSDMPAKLLFEPLSQVPWREMEPSGREEFLSLYLDHFFPTATATDIAIRVQAAVLASIRRRNPLSAAEQKRINQLSLMQPADLEVLPSLACPASGGIIAGITGMGKSSMAARIAKVIAPTPIVVHGRSATCGWSKLVQVPCLTVAFPTNGSRGALIVQFLAAIDELIGTDYAHRVRRLTIEAGLVEMMKQLSNHRVGLVIGDECQPDMFNGSRWYREFVMLMLCLMNLGIPLLLCGQPGAFDRLVAERQTCRRFSGIGIYELHRAESAADRWWEDEFIVGMLRFNLCDEIQGVEEIINQSRSLSAGVPGYFANLWIEAQRVALRRGERTATLTPSDLMTAVRSEPIHKIMLEAAEIEARALHAAAQQRLPNEDGASPGGETGQARTFRAADSQAGLVQSAVRKARREEKRRQRLAAKEAARGSSYNSTLAGDDLRLANHALELLSGLDTLQTDLALGEAKRSPNSATDSEVAKLHRG